MTEFLLMRHGEADYGPPQRWNTTGWGADLAPLTPRGIIQVRAALPAVQSFAPQLLLASPMTRAIQSAAILAASLQLEPVVEFKLHEWVPDLDFKWRNAQDIRQSDEEFRAFGEWPAGEKRRWEPVSSIRRRVLEVLGRYTNYERVIVACHGFVMYSLTGVLEIENAQLIPFHLKA